MGLTCMHSLSDAGGEDFGIDVILSRSEMIAVLEGVATRIHERLAELGVERPSE